MITRLKIEGLFGRFDYDLDFKNPVTILTGPNGFGKTTILRIIDALGNGKANVFFKTNYSSIYAEFDNGQTIDINGDSISVRFDNIEIKRGHWAALMESDEFTECGICINDFPLNDDELRSMYIDMYGNCIVQLFESLHLLSLSSDAVKGIPANRMFGNKADEDGNIIQIVTIVPDDMKKRIGDVTSVYSKKASSIDSNYLQRLFSSEMITETQYQQYLKQTDAKFAKLEKYNLMDKNLQDLKNIPKFKEEFAVALKVYFDTFFEKYAVYDEFLQKLDLFTDIVNNRLIFKKLEISRENGFEVVDTETTEILAIDQLSSGEKQVIVMYYSLIFNNENLLLLIDEPEISMHIVWQKQFMDDLIKIAEHGDFRAIVATHSPYVIGNHWESQIDLGEQYQDELYGEDVGESYGD